MLSHQFHTNICKNGRKRQNENSGTAYGAYWEARSAQASAPDTPCPSRRGNNTGPPSGNLSSASLLDNQAVANGSRGPGAHLPLSWGAFQQRLSNTRSAGWLTGRHDEPWGIKNDLKIDECPSIWMFSYRNGAFSLMVHLLTGTILPVSPHPFNPHLQSPVSVSLQRTENLVRHKEIRVQRPSSLVQLHPLLQVPCCSHFCYQPTFIMSLQSFQLSFHWNHTHKSAFQTHFPFRNTI